MNNNLIIREMCDTDVDQVTLIEESCFSMPWRRQDFVDILNNKDRIYLVAQLDGKVVGGCMMTDIVGEGDISNVAVLPDYRKQHIATQLLARMFEEGGKRGIEAYTLEVREKNQAAIKLYENAGFVSEGIRPNFYDKPKDNAVIMWKRDLI